MAYSLIIINTQIIDFTKDFTKDSADKVGVECSFLYEPEPEPLKVSNTTNLHHILFMPRREYNISYVDDTYIYKLQVWINKAHAHLALNAGSTDLGYLITEIESKGNVCEVWGEYIKTNCIKEETTSTENIKNPFND